MQARTGFERSRRLRNPEFLEKQHMKMTRLLSALRTSRFCPPCVIPGPHFRYRLSGPQDH